ncbi:MAG: EF-hand domain-containing protein [Alphaproteobacteria bacterium]|nr:EF-hand domain-containing protein [Alphaproteobacteria bacterium]
MRGKRAINRSVRAAVAVLLVLAIWGGVDAVARVAKADPAKAFTVTDRNGDGRIDRGEFHDRMTELFFFADRDRNQRLTPNELPGVAADALAAADRNGDGGLDLVEFTGARALDFDAADTDRDGQLSREEVEAASRSLTNK